MPRKPLPIIAPREGRARRLDGPMLIAAAAALVDRSGLDGLTLAALAAAAGIKAPSLYAHFRSLQHLRSKVAALGLRELDHELARAALGQSGSEAIRAVCMAYRRYARRRPGVYAAIVAWTAGGDPETEAAGAALKRTVLQILPAAAGADHAGQVHLLRMLWISLHGFVALEAAQAFGEPVDPEQTFDRLVDLLAGLVAPPRAQGARPQRRPPA